MRLPAAALGVLALLASACGGGGKRYEGPPSDPVAAFGECAFCHEPVALTVFDTGVLLSCTACHDDNIPGYFGPEHRVVPGPERVPSFAYPAHTLGPESAFGECAYCHNQTAVNVTESEVEELRCQTCHTDALSEAYGPGHRSRPGPELVPSFPNPMHTLESEKPFGSCAYCHNQTADNLIASGAGDLRCETCHEEALSEAYGPGHRSKPGPDEVPSFPGPMHALGPEGKFGDCAYCHNQTAQNLLASGSGSLRCETCHAEALSGEYGPGHRSKPGPDEVPSFPGPSHALGAEKSFGECAYCHNQTASNVEKSGAADLRCETCHETAVSAEYGPGHRSRPGPELVPSFAGPMHLLGIERPFGSCAFCHNLTADNVAASGVFDLRCQTCHEEALSEEYEPGHRSRPGADLVPSFVGAMHLLGAEKPFGSCAYCHNGTALAVTSSGTTDLYCVTCHQQALSADYEPGHRSLPGPEVVPSFVGPSHQLGSEARYGSCGYCHSSIAVKADGSSGHGTRTLACASCHSAREAGEYGPMHQVIPACAECHDGKRTHHDPAAGSVRECAVCHTPHGSNNILLMREEIDTPAAGTRPLRFTSVEGVADGSFVSVSRPGTGLCETCHSRTGYYRGDGTGAPHYTYPCFTCHSHPAGFSPP